MWWDRFLDPLRGRAITIPPLDGGLRPNTALEAAPVVAAVPHPAALAVAGGRLLVATGNEVREIGPGGEVQMSEVVFGFGRPVSALAGLGDGGFAASLEDGTIAFCGGRHDGLTLAGIGPDRLACPTALAEVPDGSGHLLVTQGAPGKAPADWVADLMEHGASGSLWRLDPASGEAQCLAGGLAWPAGVLPLADGGAIVAESWRHRLVRVAAGRAPAPVLEKLPAYPGRLVSLASGGALMALFAPRNRLVELVLQEHGYRRAMMAEVPRPLWIAPALDPPASFLEPLQCGGVRTMGVFKPWAPSRSCGLVVELDATFRPLRSWHSRADGRRHGIVDVAVHGSRAVAASRGGDAVVVLEAEERP